VLAGSSPLPAWGLVGPSRKLRLHLLLLQGRSQLAWLLVLLLVLLQNTGALRR
jgi:hypothetical protein